MQIHLKKDEKIYVNGAVMRIDRKCSLEFLNDVTFLLENHVIQAEAATTPLRQLYFVVQTMLVDPENAAVTVELYWHLSARMQQTLTDPALLAGLRSADERVRAKRNFDALKILRNLFERESALIAAPARPQPAAPVQTEIELCRLAQ